MVVLQKLYVVTERTEVGGELRPRLWVIGSVASWYRMQAPDLCWVQSLVKGT